MTVGWQRGKKFIKLNNGERVTASGKVLSLSLLLKLFSCLTSLTDD